MRPTREGSMIAKQLLIALPLIAVPAAAQAAGDPCAASRMASPIPPSRGRLVIERDTASYVARHAELACAGLEALLRDPANAGTPLAPKARVIQGELETAVLGPTFRLYPDLRGRDLTAADAPGAQVRMGEHRRGPTPHWMGPVTANHLRWVADDASRRYLAIFHTLASRSPPNRADAGKSFESSLNLDAEIGFVGTPAYWSYPKLWEIESRELEKRMPKQPRTEQSDAEFRSVAPPPGSVTLTPAAVAQMRAFADLLKGHGCQVLDLSWSLETRSKGPDDTQWQVTGPVLGVGARDCGQVPPDVVRTIDGLKVMFGGDKTHPFAGKTVDFDGKRFVYKEN